MLTFKTVSSSLAGDSFIKDFFILRNNSVFGKIQENLRNLVHVELVKDARILRNCYLYGTTTPFYTKYK